MENRVEIRTEGNNLLKAVSLGRLRLTRLLLEGGAYVNESNKLGETPLMVACKTKHVDQQSVSKVKMVKFLLEKKADPNIQDKAGYTALMHCCVSDVGAEIVALLLQNGANVDLLDHSGASALMHAINYNEHESLKLLLLACKERGKEVIIITAGTTASGNCTVKQYLNTPPSPVIGNHVSPSHVDVQGLLRKSITHQDGDATSYPPEVVKKGTSKQVQGMRFPKLQRIKSEPHGLIANSGQHNLVISDNLKHRTSKLDTDLVDSKQNHNTLCHHVSWEVAGSILPAGQSSISCPVRSTLSITAPTVREGQTVPMLCPVMTRRNTLPADDLEESMGQLGIFHHCSLRHRRASGTDATEMAFMRSTDDIPSDITDGKKSKMPRGSINLPTRRSLDGPASNLIPFSSQRRYLPQRRGSATLPSEHGNLFRPNLLPPIVSKYDKKVPTGVGLISGSSNHLTFAFGCQSPVCSKDLQPNKKLPRRHSTQLEQMRKMFVRETLPGK
uniref:ankyrin repeat domain-containing protein 34C-like n=1 Tax=Myxine glutinosa TaxID=7769 RepID=UPI00358F73AF